MECKSGFYVGDSSKLCEDLKISEKCSFYHSKPCKDDEVCKEDNHQPEVWEESIWVSPIPIRSAVDFGFRGCNPSFGIGVKA